MEYRNILIANPAKISIRMDQLVIEQSEKYTVPIEDLSAVLIESQQVQITASAMGCLAEKGVTVFFCDQKHLPSSVLFPINQYCRQRRLLLAQFEMTKPLQKRLWQQIVVRKIQNQAQCLMISGKEGGEELQAFSMRVLSNDSDNREAVAAAAYFPALFGESFSRNCDNVRNAALNYGYAIIRGTIARNLVMHGLEPCIGIHHRSELNNFNLADDLIEPFRPVVDLLVAKYDFGDETDLSPAIKARLFNLTNYLVRQVGKKYRVMSATGRTCVSFAKSIATGENYLELPELIPLEQHCYE